MARGKWQQWIEPDGLLKIEGWARDGLSEEQIARNMGCASSTLYVWKDKFPELSQALKRGREVVIREVENALIKKALGYDAVETVEELRFNRKTGKSEMVVTKKTCKHIAPDTGAIAFTLKNLAPEKWRDKRDVELTGELQAGNPFAELTVEELKKLAKDGAFPE